ncbi:hypothetical protein POM88_018202 [Heracleum sosnowskyi]|uniref:Uncharacterized protein n=1 Tax=Heracleum sosnowskyi TaxID=360622 RepID=A0AAD8IQ29_9APIA|nr:hypothetical protein POM88_018202 [Heracleum sosnowskyi]
MFDNQDQKGKTSTVIPFLERRTKVIEIVSPHGVVFALVQSGVLCFIKAWRTKVIEIVSPHGVVFALVQSGVLCFIKACLVFCVSLRHGSHVFTPSMGPFKVLDTFNVVNEMAQSYRV